MLNTQKNYELAQFRASALYASVTDLVQYARNVSSTLPPEIHELESTSRAACLALASAVLSYIQGAEEAPWI